MVIGNFNISRSAGVPLKAHAPLPIDAYAVLPYPITREGFQFIARWRLQIMQRSRRVEHLQLAFRHDEDIAEAPGFLSLENRLGIVATE